MNSHFRLFSSNIHLAVFDFGIQQIQLLQGWQYSKIKNEFSF